MPKKCPWCKQGNYKKGQQHSCGFKESDMEKYGVDERQEKDDAKLEKQAAEGCPKCGGKLERHGRTIICQNCGSEPFEGEKR